EDAEGDHHSVRRSRAGPVRDLIPGGFRLPHEAESNVNHDQRRVLFQERIRSLRDDWLSRVPRFNTLRPSWKPRSQRSLGATVHLSSVATNDYWEWVLDCLSGTVIVVRFSQEELEVWFESVKRVDKISCEWCMPGQNDAPVHNARRLRVPAKTFWRDIEPFQ
ncbi:MAG: hypothetical protein ACJAYI_000777, partial [Myxococcota bacterium]